MESRLKERLTGAAILVALIVLIVPELFRGPRPTHSPSPAPSTERSVTIDLSAPPKAAASPQGGPQAPAGVAPVPTAVESAAAAAAAAAAPTASAAREAPAPPEQAPSPAPAQTPPRAHPAGAAAPRLRDAVHSAGVGSPAAAKGTWTVQLGLFAKAANAQRLLHSAQTHGFDARVSRYGAKGLYRVAIVGLTSRTQAAQVAHRLHAAGLPAAILGPR